MRFQSETSVFKFFRRSVDKAFVTELTGNIKFWTCFLNVPLGFASGNIEDRRGNKTYCFPRGKGGGESISASFLGQVHASYIKNPFQGYGLSPACPISCISLANRLHISDVAA